jgi:surfeit locus 1 family protein
VLSARSRWWLVTLAAVVGASLTARLGWWQLDRAAQKTALQTTLDERARLPAIDGPASLAATIEAAQAQTHRAVRLVGRWRTAHTVFLDNRQMNDRVGFFVVTPLLLADGSAVVVQRGWLPRDFEQRDRIAPVPTPDGEVVVEGRVAPPPSRLYEFSGGDSGRIRQNLDLDAYARETGLALRPLSVLLADSPATAGDGLRRDWPAASAGVAQNQGYAAQWFGLSVLIVVLYVRFQLIPARRRDRR